VLVDLHAHYPMHVIPPEHPRLRNRPGALQHMVDWKGARRRAELIDWISRRANYEGNDAERPSVTTSGMAAGDVGVALSVLYWPFDEFRLGYREPAGTDFVDDILTQAGWVEDSIANEEGWTMIKDGGALERAAAGDTRGLVHCTEGGFYLGGSESEAKASVAKLADAGVAYITLAHLFWKHIATNAPALPFLRDWVYRLLFRQPREGLSRVGRAAAEEMLERRVLIDLSHMSDRSLDDVMALVPESSNTPVVATHSAARLATNPLAYNLPRGRVEQIAARGGVIGLIMCRHYIAPRHGWEPADPAAALAALRTHIDQIVEWTGSFDHVGIGSDLDGFIKPALKGLSDMNFMTDLQADLHSSYGAENAEKVCSRNALRMLRYRFGG
jgi:microsomal dipeptidase-like Zn-dependent dipeptidase